MPSRKKNGIDWKHPLTIFILTTVTAAAGWFFTTMWQSVDPSNLRAEIENPTQAIKLIDDAQQLLNGQRVFCDTAKFSLVLANNPLGKAPIVINSIGVKSEPITVNPAIQSQCNVDVFAERPHGIAERKTFILTLAKDGITGKYLASANEGGREVNPQNILESSGRNKLGITLKPEEEPLSFDFFLVSERNVPYKMWFSIEYDANGPKKLETNGILIRK